MTKQRIVFHVTHVPRSNAILSIQKYQTYKEFPRDLHLHEHIIGLRMLDTGYHQVWDGDKRWLSYTL